MGLAVGAAFTRGLEWIGYSTTIATKRKLQCTDVDDAMLKNPGKHASACMFNGR